VAVLLVSLCQFSELLNSWTYSLTIIYITTLPLSLFILFFAKSAYKWVEDGVWVNQNHPNLNNSHQTIWRICQFKQEVILTSNHQKTLKIRFEVEVFHKITFQFLIYFINPFEHLNSWSISLTLLSTWGMGLLWYGDLMNFSHFPFSSLL